MTAAGDEVSPAPVFLGANPACVALEVETRVNSSNSPDTPRAMQKHTFSTTGKHPCNEIQVSENRRWVAFGRWGPGRGGPQHRLDKPLDVKREIPCHCWWFPRSPGMVRACTLPTWHPVLIRWLTTDRRRRCGSKWTLSR